MSLLDILTLDQVVRDRVLKLRLVNKEIKKTLETNDFLSINICVNDVGVESLKSDFLQRWRGSMHLYCTLPWTIGSQWFKEMKGAVVSGLLRPPNLLSLSVEGNNLLPLTESLVGISSGIQELRIAYRGNGMYLVAAAAPLASLGGALTVEISVEGTDFGGIQTAALLQHLLALSIRLGTISLRSAR
jgi:hypothetical protein